MFYLRDCDLFDSYFYYYVIDSHFTHFSFSPFSFKHAAVANILWREEGTKFHYFLYYCDYFAYLIYFLLSVLIIALFISIFIKILFECKPVLFSKWLPFKIFIDPHQLDLLLIYNQEVMLQCMEMLFKSIELKLVK